jgi:uncharacterized membrane protein YphA (DoxX/SURF4 family)
MALLRSWRESIFLIHDDPEHSDRRCNMKQTYHPIPIIFLARFVVALVWFYEGLWLKWIGPWEDQLQIVVTSTGFTGQSSVIFLRLIGLLEIGLGIWILTGHRPLASAAVQTLILVSMNTIALFTARHLIDQPVLMVIQNLVLLVLVWMLASSGGKNHESSQSELPSARVEQYAMGRRKA